MEKVSWLKCMELASVIATSILESQDEELMKISLGQLSKIKKIIENETKAYFENTIENK